MKRRVVIHGAMLDGWVTPLGLLGIGIALLVTELLKPIKTGRSLFTWLALAAFLALVLIASELAWRRNVVELAGGRIRWSFRQPPERGDEPLENLQRVEVYAWSGARLIFKKGPVMVSLSDFPRRRVNRLVSALRDVGTPVTEMPGPRRRPNRLPSRRRYTGSDRR